MYKMDENGYSRDTRQHGQMNSTDDGIEQESSHFKPAKEVKGVE
jgi:hypothetical protein